jgi:type IV secretion system protein VirD4
MSLLGEFRAGVAAAHALQTGRPTSGPAAKPARRGEPSPFRLGYHRDPDTGKVGEPCLSHTEKHILLFGLNGAGKSTRVLIEYLMTSVGRSIAVLDIKGELAAQTADERRKFGDVKIVCPYPVVGLPSDGYNPLASLDPDNEDEFSDRAALFSDAIIEIEGKEPHWPESAQGMMQGGIMWEVTEARREGRPPSLFRVRQLLTEPDEFETCRGADGKTRKRQVKGLAINTEKMISEGGEIIAGLVGRFVREHGQNELASIQSTFDTQTRFLLSPPLARDLQKSNWSFRQLRERPTTVYIVLPAQEITRKRRWTRLLITEALCAHFRPGPVKTLFVLDEFRASVGHMPIINDVWSLVRGYGIQLMPICQSALQLKALFKDEWENYAAQAGLVATLGPPGDSFTAEWMSKRCGVTTILQKGFNEGGGVNTGHGVNGSSGVSGGVGGVNANQGSGLNYGHNISDGLSYQQVERRAVLPQELMSLADGNGFLWLPGWGEDSFPFFAPNYWDRQAPWVRRVRPNPYQ